VTLYLQVEGAVGLEMVFREQRWTSVWGCRVKEFEVIDIFPFGVNFTWEKDGENTTTTLFERGGVIPSAKMLTFYR
jgi:hypothetical protein